MGFQFNRDGAMKAGVGEHITESGVYVGKLTKAIETCHESGAVSIEFEFESNDGRTARYMRIFTQKKDGSESFGSNHIYALMGLLKLAEANLVRIDEEHQGYKVFCNKPIGVILQRENKDNGKFGMNILHFVDAVTLKTFTEHVNGEEAKESKKEIRNKVAKSAPVDTSFNFGANSNDTSPAQIEAMFGPSNDLPWEEKK